MARQSLLRANEPLAILASMNARIALAALLSITSHAPAQELQFTHAPERYTLPNGLEVVLDPVPDQNTVAVCVTYHAGARDEPIGHTGLAHLTEHLMFEGTPHAPGNYLEQLDALGAIDRNGITSRDRTEYYEVVPSEQLERVLFLEADRMAFAVSSLRVERLGLQRAIVNRERIERVDLGGLGTIPGLLASVLYPRPHAYAELEEFREDIDSTQLADVQWWMQTWYAPDTATIAVVGGFDPAQARAAIERFFGPIHRSGPRVDPAPTPSLVRQLTHERRIVVEAPLSRDRLLVVWPTPPWGEMGDAPLNLAASAIQARLVELLVNTGNALEVTCQQRSYEIASEFEIEIITARSAGTLVALQAIDIAVQEQRDLLMTPAQLSVLHGRWQSSGWWALESLTTRARHVAQHIRNAPGGHWSYDWTVTRYQNVTAEDVRSAARTWLPTNGRLVLSLAATRGAPAEGRVVIDMTPDGAQ
jgi:zinc protease